MVFGRRTTSEEPTTVEPDESDAVTPSGKGRPTPKRREAEAARKKRLAAPKTRKESSALRRERMREQRVKQRAAMQGGDPRYLPPRDQGPVKKYIRDYVDTHRTIGEFLIPIFVVLFVAVYAAPAASALGTFGWLVIILLLAFDSIRVMRGVRRGITERFGAAETRGITMYTLMRAWQMRRLRLPKPQLKPGNPIP